MTRRELLKTTLLFSSALMAGKLDAALPERNFPASGIDLLALGDFGSNDARQHKVAVAMADFTAGLGRPLSAVLALGDNFYRKFLPEQFATRFSGYYPKNKFDCPFYAVLGNHDYGPEYDSKQGRAKAETELDHTRKNPGSRWKMPAKWYAYELEKDGKPLVKIIALDGSYFEGALTPQEKIEQRRWLAAEMAKPTAAPWLWMISHYPIFSDSKQRGDRAGAPLLKEWEPYLRDKRVSLYIAGHDHTMQHLRAEGFSPDFIISGAGGAPDHDVIPSPRGFSTHGLGFNHIHVTEEKITVQYIDGEGRKIHAFERDRAGKLTLLPV